MDDRRPEEPRYTAFLSYSHKDAAAAGRVHRRLETYRMPKRLVGTETARGPVPARLAPIFRDREELPAATDLSTTVREALAQSGALIVLCSPAAAASLWVAEEIETFRRIHPDRPVLAAVLDADPPDCFPQVLRALGRDGTWHEPLATDLRRHCDGPRLGLLKLVAGITGVGLDALVQRDAARRIRRVMAVTGAALVAMLAMATLTWFALDARKEAERQRAAAERQIEFMLTDLRASLRGRVGALDIMTAVSRHALAYYDGQDLSGLGTDSLERRARLLHALGEDNVARGDVAGALTAFVEAHRITAEQLARDPDDARLIFGHGQSEYWLGHVYQLRRNWPEAREHYARYAAAARRLIALAPGNPDYMLEMAYGASNLGLADQYGARDLAGAQQRFEEAIRWFGMAVRTRPGDDSARLELANAYGNLADTFYARGLWRQNLTARMRQYEISASIQQADPANIEKTFRLGAAERAVALASGRVGDRERAQRFRSQAYQRAQDLTARDPNNAEWLLFRTLVECDLAAGPSSVLPRGVTPLALRRSIGAAGLRLTAQRNPRISEISVCLGHLRAEGGTLRTGAGS